MVNLDETPRQVVNEESMRYAILSSSEIVYLFKELNELEWEAIETSIFDTQLVNTTFIIKKNENLTEGQKVLISQFIDRIKLLPSMLGYTQADLKALRVYIDPVETKYEEAHAIYNIPEGHIWIKENEKGLGIDHELSHWVTMSVSPSRYKSLLAIEGSAAWLAWSIRNDQDKHDLSVENYNNRVKELAGQIPREAVNMDENNIDNVRALFYGGVLFEVIFDHLDKDYTKFGKLWKDIDNHKNISNWLKHNNINPKVIDKEWKDRIYGPQKFLPGVINLLVYKLRSFRNLI